MEIEVVLNGSEGNQAENTHLKWKDQRNLCKLKNNGGGGKAKVK